MSESKDQTRTLTLRGIGRRYHKLSLADSSNEHAPKVIDWLKKEQYKEGQGLTFYCKDNYSAMYDLAMLAARGAILSGLPKLEVHNFHNLVEKETLPETPLLITCYENSEGYKRIDAHIHSSLDNKVPVLLHVVDMKLLSPTLQDRMKNINLIFE